MYKGVSQVVKPLCTSYVEWAERVISVEEGPQQRFNFRTSGIERFAGHKLLSCKCGMIRAIAIRTE